VKVIVGSRGGQIDQNLILLDEGFFSTAKAKRAKRRKAQKMKG